jgi:hypothetical protein
MKKKKLFIILIVTIAALVFATAQICNQCGIVPSRETKEDVAGDTGTDNTGAATTEREASSATAATTITGNPQAPEIVDLDVFMGPEYSEESGFCFYRVRVEATGNPEPDIVFSKDDSGNAWGDDVCQVNIEDPADTYTLIVTATNSEGEDEATLDFEWDCDGAEPEPEPEPVVLEDEITIDADADKSGYISDGTAQLVWMGNWVYIGDNTGNKLFKGYLTFSLSHFSGITDITLTDVEIRIPGVEYHDKPWEAGDELHILVKDYGDTIDYPEDFEVGGEVIKVFATSDSIDNLNFSTTELKDELQNALSIGKELFQLKFSLTNKSNNGDADWYRFPADSAEMYVKYEFSE